MRLLAAWLGLIVLVAPFAASAEREGPPHGGLQAQRCASAGVGLGGFDPVSYHTADGGAPVRGSPAHASDDRGVRYWFTSAENRDRFALDPAAYLPRYGGWCAMSLALGSFICPDYENYQFQEGRLYLFETTVFTNGRTLWNQDPDGNRGLADRNYSRVAQ